MEFNPFEMPKAMFQEFEKGLGAYLEKTMRDPAFMKIMSKNMAMSLDMQSTIKKHLAQALEHMDIPTNSALSGLYQTVHNLETRLLDLEEKVEELEDRLARNQPQPQPQAVEQEEAKPAPAPKAAKAAKATSSPKPRKAPARKKATKKS